MSNLLYINSNEELILEVLNFNYNSGADKYYPNIRWEMTARGETTEIGTGKCIRYTVDEEYEDEHVVFCAYLEEKDSNRYPTQKIECYVVKKAPEDLQVEAVKGTKCASMGETVEFEVTEYNVDRKLTEYEKYAIKWSVKIGDDDAKVFVDESGEPFRGDKIRFVVPAEWAGKEVIVMAYFHSPTESNSQKVAVAKPKPKSEPPILSIQWFDSHTHREITQMLSDQLVDLRIETSNLERGTELRIVIRETSGQVLRRCRRGGEEVEQVIIRTKENDDTLIITDAFSFSRERNEMNREVQVIVYWCENYKVGETTLREVNGGIWGLTARDAEKVRDDIREVFAGDNFVQFRELLTLDRTGRRLNPISETEKNNVFAEITLNRYEQRLVDLVVEAINCSRRHDVEFADIRRRFSRVVRNAVGVERDNLDRSIREYERRRPDAHTPEAQARAQEQQEARRRQTDAEFIQLSFGDGINFETETGSHSVILMGSGVVRAVGRAHTTMHEVIGHGIPSARRDSRSNNATHAVRVTNLVRRMMGLPLYEPAFHDNVRISSPNRLP